MTKETRTKLIMNSGVSAVAIIVMLLITLVSCGKETNQPDGGNPSVAASSTASVNSQTGDNGLDETDLPALIAKLPANDVLDEIHSLFSGYWIVGSELFVGFIYENDAAAIDYGIYQTSFGECGKITEANAVSAKEFTLSIHIPAKPATDMDDAKPERTEMVYIDISNYNDNRLNIKIGDEWRTYEYGGGSIEEAFN